MIKKNDKYTVTIEDLTGMGSGVAKIEGITIFIENAVPGDVAEILILKVKKTYGYGKIIELITPSQNRVEPICPVAHQCGGCSIMQMDYATQLSYKSKQVLDAFVYTGGFDRDKIIKLMKQPKSLENPYHYRNKVIFPVREINGKITVGFFKKNSHVPVDYYDCFISDKENKIIIDNIIGAMKEHGISAYNENTHSGLVRGIFIRRGFVTKETMVALVVNDKNFVPSQAFIDKINADNILINYNTKKENTLLTDNSAVVKGRDYIEDFIGNANFRISLNSFYQVNSVLCKELYDEIIEMAKPTKEDVLLDAYCGIGTIALYMADYVKEVYGVEIVPQAIKNANTNKEINKIKNANFLLGLAEEKIKEFDTKMDIVVLDPPRKGVDEVLIEELLKMQPQKIIYVSCNPITLARDLKKLCEVYQLNEIRPYDFFAHSSHVETIVSLTK